MNENEIRALARLAKLDINPEEFKGEFEEIIAFADRINDAVSGDTLTIKAKGGLSVALENLRADEIKESLPNEKIVSNIESERGYFPVKRVVK